jgi:hypothetical protein
MNRTRSYPSYWKASNEYESISRDIEAARRKSEKAALFFRLGLSAGGILFVGGATLFVLPVYLWNRQFRPDNVKPKKRRPAFEQYKKNAKR